MAGGYWEVNLLAVLILANSSWFPCLILTYWSFVLGWWLMVFLEGVPLPCLKRSRTGLREESGCDSQAGFDLWSYPKVGPGYLRAGSLYLLFPASSTSHWMQAPLRKWGMTLDKVVLDSLGENEGPQLRVVSSQHSFIASGEFFSP